MDALKIDAADDPSACRATEDIQRRAWGMADRGIVPAEHIRAAVHNGGLLLLATIDDVPVGFCYGFVGRGDERPILCSHMLAVVPEVRSSGVGRALKLAQRDHAEARGFASIVWTFDPLQARNAYLNLRRLGAFARTYLIDHYGAMEDELNAGLPSDRLLAEWPLTTTPASNRATSRGVTHREGGRTARTDVDVARTSWILRASDGLAKNLPGTADTDAARDHRTLVAVPADIDRLRRSDPQAGTAWRTALRTALTAAFDRGLVAVDVVRDAQPGCHAYVLERTTDPSHAVS